MAKKKSEEIEEIQEQSEEMSLAEAKAYRASLHKAKVAVLSNEEKREKFRLYWAEEKYKYGQPKDLEDILWLHLKAIKMDAPEKFAAGLDNFGIKKIK